MSFPYIVVYCEDPAGIQFKASYQYRPQAQGRVYKAVRKIIFNQPLYKISLKTKMLSGEYWLFHLTLWVILWPNKSWNHIYFDTLTVDWAVYNFEKDAMPKHLTLKSADIRKHVHIMNVPIYLSYNIAWYWST